MIPDLIRSYELLEQLVSLPCKTKEDFNAWTKVSNQLDEEISKEWKWFEDSEFHDIQHFLIDVQIGSDGKDWREHQKEK